MQKITLFLFLALLCAYHQSTAQGQCKQYNYFVQTQGFNCDPGLGQICFVTSANWTNPSTCSGYVVELEFPTGSFIYTNLGDFYLYSQTQTKVVLRYEPQFLSEGLTVGCLEGVLQVPGTVFTLRVVWPTNPNDVVGTTTFTLDGAMTIGAPGQTTLLSDAIIQHKLLPVAQAATTGQTVIIDGTLVVDEPYAFGISFGGLGNEITMKPGARIEVGTAGNGVQLSTLHMNIHGCNGIWDRILVHPGSTLSAIETNVNDADVAMELENNSNLTIGNVVLTNNHVGIGSYGPALKNISLTILSSIFEKCTIQNGQEGCHFENVDFVDLSGNLRIQDMALNGVYLNKTDMNGYFLSFFNCPTDINSDSPNSLLTVDHSEFGDGQVGIRSLGALEMDVTGSYFHGLNFGIARTTSVLNEHLAVKNNVMVLCNYNIFAVAQPSYAEIQSNRLSATYQNVVVWAYGAGLHKWAVQYNDDMHAGIGNTNGYNVSFVGVNDGRIFKNNHARSSLYNFSIWGGSLAKIGYNIDDDATVNNIRINDNPSGIVYCNGLSGNTGITMTNTCSGTILRGNTMTGAGQNLSYGTIDNKYATTGAQPYKGNIFDPSSDANKKAVNYSAASIAQTNQFLVGTSSGGIGTPLYPYFDSSFPKWFQKDDQNSDYSCPPGIVGDEAPSERLQREIQSHAAVLDAGVENLYGSEVAFDVKLKLFRALTQLQQIESLNPTNQGLYNSLAGSPVAPFIAFEQAYKNASSLTINEGNQAAQLAQDLKALTTDMNGIAWYNYDVVTEKATIDPVQKAIYDGKLTTLKTKTTALETLLGNRRQILLNQLANLSAILAGIPATGTASAQNLKKADLLLLRRITPQFSGYTAAELQTLHEVAGLCSSTNGEGVFIARSLLAETTMSPSTYYDECISGVQDREAAANHRPAPLSIAPNPANDVATVTIPEIHNYHALLIFDLPGREVRRIELAEGQTEVKIVTAGLSPGVYIVAPEGKFAEAVKLVVSR